MFRLSVIGNVGRNPESRHDSKGGLIVSFSIAVNLKSKDTQKTEWIEVSCFDKTAESAAKFVRTGMKLLVEGYPKVNAYINKEGKAVGVQKINATTIEYLNSPEGSVPSEAKDNEKAKAEEPVSQDKPDDVKGPQINDSDIPF